MTYQSPPSTLSIPREVQQLLTLAALPLIDGFYLAWLNTNLWADPYQAIAFGLTAFSGAGCVIAAMQLTGTAGHRLLNVGVVYAIVTFGAFMVLLAQPVFASLLPPNLHLFTGVFLLGLGMSITNISVLRRFAHLMGFDAAVKVMLAASVIQGCFSGVEWRVALDLTPIPAVSLAVVAGLGLTLAGWLMGILFAGATDLRPLNWGAGLSLTLMGLSVLGLVLPSWVVIVPLAVGCLWVFTIGRR